MPNAHLAPRNWKEELKRIIDFLNRDDIQAERLWYVLSALRGPDQDENGVYSETIKSATTAVIRDACGLTYQGLDIQPDSSEKQAVRNAMTTWSHFKQHAMNAFDILEIPWLVVPPEHQVKPETEPAEGVAWTSPSTH